MGILYGPLAAYLFSFLWSPSFKMVILILFQGLKVVVNAMWSQLPVWKVGVLEEFSDFILMERDCLLDSDFCLCLEILHFAMVQAEVVTIHTVCLAAPAWRWESGWKTWTWQLKWPRNLLRNLICFWTTPYAIAPTVSDVSCLLEMCQTLSPSHFSYCKFDDINGIFYCSYGTGELLYSLCFSICDK